MAHRRWEAELAEFRAESQVSSPDLELRAAAILQDALADLVPASADECLRRMVAAGRRVIAAQPASAGIFRLVNDMLWAAAETSDADAMRVRALGSLAERYEAGRAALGALVQAARPWLVRYPVVMTYSRSEAVLGALLAVHAERQQFTVLCGESRPRLEGQLLAYELGTGGVRVTLGIDMALFGWLPTASALVVGAEGVSSAGVAVKTGTQALLRAAAELELPRIVLASTARFLPAEYAPGPEPPSAEPDEIMPPIRNVTVRNQILEAAPLELVSFLVTEGGRLELTTLRERLTALRVYPGLVGAPAR